MPLPLSSEVALLASLVCLTAAQAADVISRVWGKCRERAYNEGWADHRNWIRCERVNLDAAPRVLRKDPKKDE